MHGCTAGCLKWRASNLQCPIAMTTRRAGSRIVLVMVVAAGGTNLTEKETASTNLFDRLRQGHAGVTTDDKDAEIKEDDGPRRLT